MAVQAQYPPNALLFNKSEQETKEMDYSQNPNEFLNQPSIFFNNGGGGVNVNQRKRGRESSFQMVPTPPPQMNLFSLQSHHHHRRPSLVSTGLHLSSIDDDNNNNQTQNLSSLIKQKEIEIDQYLFAQGEQLRRTLAEKTLAHYRALLGAAEETAARRLKEKEVELNLAVRRTTELEAGIVRIRNEALTWQAKATSEEAAAAALHAKIQQVQLAAAAANKRAAAEECLSDAGSAHVDPNRAEDSRRACRVCGVSEVSVVLIPCRHLCLCLECDGAVGETDAIRCPVCHAVRTGSVQVLFS